MVCPSQCRVLWRRSQFGLSCRLLGNYFSVNSRPLVEGSQCETAECPRAGAGTEGNGEAARSCQLLRSGGHSGKTREGE